MRISLLAICMLMVLAAPLGAEEFLRGRVLEMSREKGEIVLMPRGFRHCRRGPAAPDQDPPPPPPPGPLYTITISPAAIPAFVEPGSFIRVWGDFAQGEELHFQAVRIAGPGRRHGHDSTGVRERLRRRCFMNDPHPSEPPPPPHE